jgi:hypothetical protein
MSKLEHVSQNEIDWSRRKFCVILKFLRFEVLTAVKMSMVVRAEDGGSAFLQNVGTNLQVNMMSLPRDHHRRL